MSFMRKKIMRLAASFAALVTALGAPAMTWSQTSFALEGDLMAKTGSLELKPESSRTDAGLLSVGTDLLEVEDSYLGAEISDGDTSAIGPGDTNINEDDGEDVKDDGAEAKCDTDGGETCDDEIRAECDDEDEEFCDDELIELPELYFAAVNPGYTSKNVGELIEIRSPLEAPHSLAGIQISYSQPWKDSVILAEFDQDAWMTGDNLVLRYKSTEGDANLTYVKSLTQSAGVLTLERDGEILDTICWGGECENAKFKSGSGETLVFNIFTGNYERILDYSPEFSEMNYEIREDSEAEETESTSNELEESKAKNANSEEKASPAANKAVAHCGSLSFSEILTYYETDSGEQFVELKNNSDGTVRLDGCQLKYKNKLHALSGEVSGNEFYVYRPEGFTFTKKPSSSNTLALVDEDETIVDTLVWTSAQKKSTSLAQFDFASDGSENWLVTYQPTPGAENVYQEFRTCVEGKIINPETGNCVKITTTTAKTCKDGYYLNPSTNRCKKIASETTSVKTCQEGYYLSPSTNRCRKTKVNDGAGYGLTSGDDEYNNTSNFVAGWAVAGVLVLLTGYIIYQYRLEIRGLFDKVFRRVPKKPLHGAGRHSLQPEGLGSDNER